MSDGIAVLILDHGVPGTERVWRSRRRRYWGRLGDCVVRVGALDDGRWYVNQLGHPVGGPWRAELFGSEEDAETVARAVMADLQPRLLEADYRPFEIS